MVKRHGTRRWFLSSVGVFVAAWTALGHSPGAGAKIRTTKPRPDYASREAFRLECALLGGTFTGTGSTIACELPGVGRVECDEDGKNCTSTTGGHQPGGGANSPDGTGTHAEPGSGGTNFPGLPGEPLPDTLPKLPGAGG
jgi:hypothetical protein